MLWSSRSGQLLIATTIAPTTAIRTHNNSLSPHRFIRVRICGLPAISDAYYESKAHACRAIRVISVSSDYPGKEDRANPHRSHCAEAGKEPFSFHKGRRTRNHLDGKPKEGYGFRTTRKGRRERPREVKSFSYTAQLEWCSVNPVPGLEIGIQQYAEDACHIYHRGNTEGMTGQP